MTKDYEGSKKLGSKEIAAAAIKIALTADRNEEKLFQADYAKVGFIQLLQIMEESLLILYEDNRTSCCFFKKGRSHP
jgi:hypothetical protein